MRHVRSRKVGMPRALAILPWLLAVAIAACGPKDACDRCEAECGSRPVTACNPDDPPEDTSSCRCGERE